MKTLLNFGLALAFASFAVAIAQYETIAAPRFISRFAPEPSTQKIMAADGFECSSLVFIPKGKGPHPALIVLHSGGSRSAGAIGAFRKYGAAFAPLGYGIVAPDYRTGALGGDSLLDVLGTIDFIARHERLDRSKVIIIGDSQGAYLAALAASRESVLAIVCAGGFYDLSEYMLDVLVNARSPAQKKLYLETVSELGEPAGDRNDAYAARSPELRAEYISSRVLMFHGENDTEIGWQYSQRFAGALQSAGITADLYVLPNAGHSVNIVGDTTAHYVINFLGGLGLPIPEEEPLSSIPEDEHGGQNLD